MKITIHQPEHMPWLGFFHKVSQVDACVILDNVQYRDRYFQNRNKIRNASGEAWITVPVKHNRETLIKDVLIAPDNKWKKKWWNSILCNYSRSQFGKVYFRELEETIFTEREMLSDINCALIKFLAKHLGIKTEFILASGIGAEGKGSDIILDICRKSNAQVYLSGISGKEYLKLNDFKQEGIYVEFQEFHHPIYRQLYEPFIPCMSSFDLLCNYGEDSLDIINGKGVQVMQGIFL